MIRTQVRLDRRRHYVPSVVARFLDVETFTVLSWIRKGQLRAMNIGTGKTPYYQVFRADLIDFMIKRGASDAHIEAITGVAPTRRGLPANSLSKRASSQS